MEKAEKKVMMAPIFWPWCLISKRIWGVREIIKITTPIIKPLR